MSAPSATAVPPRPVALAVRPDGIPVEMKAERRWVVWRYVWRWDEAKRKGKWDKPPLISTAPDRKASSIDPATWSTFGEALAAYESGKCDGIGFMLGDGWVGFDCDAGGAPEFIALLDSYAETSPSGRGVHAIMRGEKPAGACRTGPYELYAHARYFTVTGHAIGGRATVEERTAQIAELHARLFAKAEPKHEPESPAASGVSRLSDGDLLTRARESKNGAKFTQLWNGDASAHGGDHSAADLSLCSMLAFWSGKDAAQVDRMFRRSALMRPKWDERHGERTYGERTIATAIAGCEQAYRAGPTAAVPPQGGPDEPSVAVICASEVKVEKMSWLWPARLARGAITLVEGGPEHGKSTVLVDLVARVSRGESFPGETATRDPMNAVMLIAEDDLGATVVPRLIAAGADLGRVFFLSATRDADGHVVPFHVTDDCERLRRKCEEIGDVALVVVDPLVSYLGSRRGRTINTYNDLEVRKALAPLKELAEQLRASIAAIRHYRKGRGTDAMEAGGGSVAFAALVRVIVAALPDPEDEQGYLLAVAKNNLVVKSKRPAFSYHIVPADTDPDVGRIAWGRAVEMSANEILGSLAEAEKGKSGKTAEAKQFLEELLGSGEWVPSTEIARAAKDAQVSESSLRRGKHAMDILVERRGDQWGWRLNPGAM